MAEQKSVLFVCLGNICRSPMAEAIFRDLIKKRALESQWKADSAAVIDFHKGKQPESRARSTLEKFGVKGYRHAARVLTVQDGDDFDYIFGMDDQNVSDIKDTLRGDAKASVEYLGSYDPQEGLKTEIKSCPIHTTPTGSRCSSRAKLERREVNSLLQIMRTDNENKKKELKEKCIISAFAVVKLS